MDPCRSACGDPRSFVFIHVGDLHLTAPTPGDTAIQRRQRDLVSNLTGIFADVRQAAGGPGSGSCIDFVYLPGDIAQNGCATEYAILERVLAAHPHLPVRLIPGDHDRQLGTMDDFAAFRRSLSGAHDHPGPAVNPIQGLPTGCPPATTTAPVNVLQFYFSQVHGTTRCIFLDMVSAGYGRQGFGLDFRLGEQQFAWVQKEIAAAALADEAVAVFAHAYPDDMKNPDDREGRNLAGLFWSAGVRLVEMGHTHYSELAPDGRTLYAAARSVGQNEDGPVGYAVVAIDGDAVSWRFRQLQQTWPFVLVTSPADRRLATGAPTPAANGTMPVRAVVLSDRGPGACTCECRVDDGPWLPMAGRGCAFTGAVPWPPGSRSLSVRVTDGRWPDPAAPEDFVDIDTIEPAAHDVAPRRRPDRPGSDAQRITEPWPEKGIRGDQLGPNKGGRKW